MSWSLSNITLPAADYEIEEGTTLLDLIKDQCRVPRDWTGDDSLLRGYMLASISEIEKASDRIIRSATATFIGRPSLCTNDGIWLGFETRTVVPLLPAEDDDIERGGIVSVSYKKADGTWSAYAEENYELEDIGKEPATILLAAGLAPDLDVDSRFPYKIVANVGYAQADMPASALQCILLWCAEFYSCREVLTYAQTGADFKRPYDAQIRNLQWRMKG